MKRAARKVSLAVLAAALILAAPVVADGSRLADSRDLTRTFGASLKRELKVALERGGPVAAIEVCKDLAPQIASELSRRSGAKVRRTSLR